MNAIQQSLRHHIGFFSSFLEEIKQQKSIFVLCILSSKLICLFCNIFSPTVRAALACVLLIQCFPLVINAFICHFKINWCGFHIIYVRVARALHTHSFDFAPRFIFFGRSLPVRLHICMCNLAHLFSTIPCYAMLCSLHALF